MIIILRKSKFSIIIDETTDQSTVKQLAIVAFLFDVNVFEFKTYLLDMVVCSDGTAQGIYKALKDSFEEYSIPMENVVGYSSDTTNVMFRERLSVSALLKADYPHVITVKCSCHLIHLASSCAAAKLPKCLEDLVQDIFAHFSRSAKRQEAYKSFNPCMKLSQKKLCHLHKQDGSHFKHVSIVSWNNMRL